MLALGAETRVFLYKDPVDMRKGFEGLQGLVSEHRPLLLEGVLFAFLNRNCKRIKVLYWDGDGLGLWYKRLEKGCFQRQSTSRTLIRRSEFIALLEGVKLQRKMRLQST